MDATDDETRAARLARHAERLASYAETAELMGDAPTAARFRELATEAGDAAMQRFDDDA